MAKLESLFSTNLKNEIAEMFPGCIIMKNDANYLQGIPDLTILYQDWWAVLEVKRSEAERNDPRPNQEWYVELFNSWSFSAFIYPENKEEILDALQQSFRSRRSSRVSQRQ